MKLIPTSENQQHYGTICVYPHSITSQAKALVKLYDELIEIISKHEKIFVAHSGNFVASHANHSVCEIELPIKNIWIRDYAPIWGIVDGALCAVTFQYEKANKHGPAEEYLLNNELIRILNLHTTALEQEFEGDNYLSDGRHIYLCKNPIGKDRRYRQCIEQRFNQIFDIEKIIWISNRFKLDVCRHLDNVCCLSNDKKLIHFRQPRTNDFMANIYRFNGGILLSERYKKTKAISNYSMTVFLGKSFFSLIFNH